MTLSPRKQGPSSPDLQARPCADSLGLHGKISPMPTRPETPAPRQPHAEQGAGGALGGPASPACPPAAFHQPLPPAKPRLALSPHRGASRALLWAQPMRDSAGNTGPPRFSPSQPRRVSSEHLRWGDAAQPSRAGPPCLAGGQGWPTVTQADSGWLLLPGWSPQGRGSSAEAFEAPSTRVLPRAAPSPRSGPGGGFCPERVLGKD